MEDNFIRFERKEDGTTGKVVEKLIEEFQPVPEADLQAEYNALKEPREQLVNKHNELVDARDNFTSEYETELESKNDKIEELSDEIDEKDLILKSYEEFLGIEETETETEQETEE